MKPKHSIFHPLLWSAMIFVIGGLITTGILTNTTLRSIEKNIPSTLLTELNDLSSALENLTEVVAAAQIAQAQPNTDNLKMLRGKVATVYNDTVKLRETYVFDNLIQALNTPVADHFQSCCAL